MKKGERWDNEALQLLDIIVAACVEEPPRSSPPVSPSAGLCYLVASGASGDWAGFDDHIAAYSVGGWRFVAPKEGLRALVRSSGSVAHFRLGQWEIGALVGSKVVVEGHQVVSGRGASVASPTGGTMVDVQARTAIEEILGRLQEHGLIAHP